MSMKHRIVDPAPETIRSDLAVPRTAGASGSEICKNAIGSDSHKGKKLVNVFDIWSRAEGEWPTYVLYVCLFEAGNKLYVMRYLRY